MRYNSSLRRLPLLFASLMGIGLAACDDGDTPATPDLAAPDALLDMGAGDIFVTDAGGDARPLDAALDAGPPEEDGGVDRGPDPDVHVSGCDIPLTLDPTDAVVAPFGLQIMVAAGGSGAWRFDLAPSDTGGRIHPTTGAYLAGGAFPTEDTVILTDEECPGEARARITVVPPLILRPSSVTIAPGDGFEFITEGGSGEIVFRWISEGSGGALTEDGQYTAGPTPGFDVVEAVDPGTGLAARARIDVVEDPQLVADPARLFLAEGSLSPVTVSGGSGEVLIDVEGDAVEFDQDASILQALAPGRADLVVRDRFVDQQTTLTVDVVSPLRPSLRRLGRGTLSAIVRPLGDIDGDGFADAALAMSELSIDQAADGAVVIYRGGEGGLAPEPAQILFGARRDTEFGKALEVLDVDGDGRVDLVIGAWRDSEDGLRRGSVGVYRGLAGGRFEAQPSWVVYGERNDDQFGAAITICDFDGDDRPDLAVDAHLLDDVEADRAGVNLGGIYLFRGVDGGFSDSADDPVLFGSAWTLPSEDPEVDDGIDAPGLHPRRDLRFGTTLASGDFDGDGFCDLIAATPTVSTGEGRSQDGAIHLYRGAADGLSDTPSRVWIGDEEDVSQGAFGRRIAVADLNGDGRDDIVAGHHGLDDPGFGPNIGAIRFIAGEALDGAFMAPLSAGDTNQRRLGDFQGDQYGFSVSVGDFDGDEHVDLVVGSLTGTAEPVFGEPGPATGGTARVYRGMPGDWPDVVIGFEAFGPIANEGFGEAAAIIGDATGDGQPDLMVMAARADDYGTDVGRPYFIDGATHTRVALDLPGSATGAWFGWTMALLPDLSGDGLRDLLVGAPEHNVPEAARGGSAFVFSSTNAGFTPTDSERVEAHFHHTAADLYGYGLATGDFDGDGRPDVAIAARAEDAFEFNPEGGVAEDGRCPATGADFGVTFIHRLGPDGVAPDPTWAIMGPAARALMSAPAFADLDGDGRDELVFGGWQWNNAEIEGSNEGGIAVYAGRPPDPGGRIRVVCDPRLLFQGDGPNARVGATVHALGDIDGDGCDEVAFGAPVETVEEIRAAGVVRILYGWGGAGCAARPAIAAFSGRNPSSEFGAALATGDVIGDARPDLLVGAPTQIEPRSNQRRGAFYVIDAQWLAGLRPTAIADRRAFVVTADPGARVVLIHGDHNGSRFGHAVAATGRVAIASHLFSPIGRTARVGGGSMYRIGEAGPRRVAGFISETWRPGNRIGESLVADPERPVVLFGGAFGAGFQPDAGAVYPLLLDALP